ncbi:hypothetical protein KHC28_11355 [Ancylobacter sonchi]|uniref:hypothetical protein n=1 Tax=Ancylobacter sonchi TaxID=1937790 RepID=UPI001BD367B9|nr:hypothetical protein [Ancylobacter sonchi]MBS7534255.1 hypothetical protein [Ancylobacter sonchi]
MSTTYVADESIAPSVSNHMMTDLALFSTTSRPARAAFLFPNMKVAHCRDEVTDMAKFALSSVVDVIAAAVDISPHHIVVVIRHTDVVPEQAASILKAWRSNGVIEEVEYHDDAERKARKGVRVVEANRPGRAA